MLLPLVANGLGALKNAHRGYFDAAIRQTFADSLDLDEAMQPDHEQANRWDYLLGHAPSGNVAVSYTHLDVYKRQVGGVWGATNRQLGLLLASSDCLSLASKTTINCISFPHNP